MSPASRTLPSLLLALGLALAAAASAEQAEGPALSEPTWRALQAVHELMDAGKWDEALGRLQALAPKVEANAYESAVTAQTLGYVYGSLERYPQAIEAFSRALAGQALPADVAHTLLYNLAQLLIHQERYEEGIARLETWLKAEPKPGLEAHVLAATAYYRAGRYAAAVPHARKVIEQKKDAEDDWFRLLLACYQELEDYEGMAGVLEQLVRRRPEERDYWLQLAATYQRLQRDARALATLELANRRGLLDEDKTLQLARLYLYLEMPYPAARLLEDKTASGAVQASAENLDLLGEAWLRAREPEKALPVLERAAAASPEAGRWLLIGQIYCDLERWQEARAPLERALAGGGLERPAQARLLLGVASAETGDAARARELLTQALEDAATREQARWWLGRLAEEPEAAEDKT